MSNNSMLKYEENDSAISDASSKTTNEARCAIDEDGYLVYANSAFCELVGISPHSRHHFSDIIQFSDDIEEEINDSGDLSAVNSGTHDVNIKDNGILAEFHFDWLATPENKNYLIASALENEEEYDGNETKIDELMSQIQESMARIENSHEYETKAFQSHLEQTNTNNESFNTEDIAVFMDMSSDIMVITDIDGYIIYANDSFLEISGISTHDNINLISIYSFLDGEEKIYFSQNIQRVHEEFANDEQIESNTLCTKFYSKNGNVRHVEWRQKYENAKIYISGNDVTDIKEKQQHLQHRERQLSEAEAIGRMGHWHWPVGKEEIIWSDEIYRIFGVDKESYNPRISSLGGLVYKRDLGRVIQIFQRAIIEEKSYDMEFRINRPDGETRFIMCEGRCKKNHEGEVIALYGIMQDMTERVLYEQELRRAKDAYEQAYAAKSRFLANMSHELRTPLNAIIGFSEMIESQMLGPIFNEKYVEYATSIRESGNHLLDLISDILDMSKIEAGKHVLDLEEIRIKDIIDRSLEMVNGRAKEKNISVRPPYMKNDNLKIVCDRRAITQILLNLLSNAIKFTNPGGSVWMECIENEKSVCFKVCDNGIGIPPNKLASVLKPFEQASNEYTRQYEGTGLGLSITKELIEMHGGTINIESTVDIGTTAIIRLPYTPNNGN